MRDNINYFGISAAPPARRISLFSELISSALGKLRFFAFIVSVSLLFAASLLGLGVYQIAVLYLSDRFSIFPINVFFLANFLLSLFLLGFVLLSGRLARNPEWRPLALINLRNNRRSSRAANITAASVAHEATPAHKRIAVLLIIKREEAEKPTSRSAAA